MPKVYVNGKLVELDEAAIPAADSGFLYGVGLFETMRCVHGRLFAIEAHLNRLLASARALGVPCALGRDELAEAIYRTLEANGLSDARIRLTLSGGVQRADGALPTLVVTAGPLGGYPTEHYDKGVRVVLSDFRQNVQDPTTGHKTTSFFPRLLALQQAHAKGAAEALWFTHGGLLAEGCISNVFLVKDGTLRTPRLQTPIMPGVARRHVLTLAGEMGISAAEEDLTIDNLLAADEVFLTNVIMLVLPVVGVEAHTVGEGRPGPITRRLSQRLCEITEGTDETENRP